MNGSWKKASSENGLAFAKAIGATDEQLAKQAKTTTIVTYTVTGTTISTTRVYTGPGMNFLHLKEGLK